MTKNFSANVGDRKVDFSIDETNFIKGSNEVISEASPNSIKSQDWYDKGYCVIDILDEKEHAAMLGEAKNLITKTFDKLSIPYDDKFTVENYHKYITDDETHTRITRTTRDFDTADLSKFVNIIYDRLSQKLGVKFADKNDKTHHEILILRISRPFTKDMNPAHRDAYQDVWKKSLNIWYKLTGDNNLSTLPMMPRSHFFSEDKVERTDVGSVMNGLKYNVPIITNTPEGLNFIRPEIKPGQVLVFTPFIIHGLAANYGDVTRTAVELRPVVVN